MAQVDGSEAPLAAEAVPAGHEMQVWMVTDPDTMLPE